MNSFLQNVVSCFEKLTGVHQLASTDGVVDVVLSNNSYTLENDHSEMSSDSCNHYQVGILYADIAGYTRLTELDDESTYVRMVESMNKMEACIQEYHGRITYYAGYAVLAEFPDVDDALNCAFNMFLSDRRRNIGLSSDRQIRFRIGVNYGDAFAHENYKFKSAGYLAERLINFTHSGGIYVSESVRQWLGKNSSFNFKAMEE